MIKKKKTNNRILTKICIPETDSLFLEAHEYPNIFIVCYCCTKGTEGIICAVAEGTYCKSFPFTLPVPMQVREWMYCPPGVWCWAVRDHLGALELTVHTHLYEDDEHIQMCVWMPPDVFVLNCIDTDCSSFCYNTEDHHKFTSARSAINHKLYPESTFNTEIYNCFWVTL